MGMIGQKPTAVVHAERSLWAWLGWTCLYGASQIWGPSSAAANEIAGQVQTVLPVTPASLQSLEAAGYALAALSIAWLIVKIGAGKNWARVSLLITFILEALWAWMQPGAGLVDYLTDVPDLGLQGYALYQLYTKSSQLWFARAKA